jgi:transposase
LAYIYEWKKIGRADPIENAYKLLDIEKDNRVALFVLARNEKNIEIKIEMLKKVTELYPHYARAFNTIGKLYSDPKKEYENAIAWQ